MKIVANLLAKKQDTFTETKQAYFLAPCLKIRLNLYSMLVQVENKVASSCCECVWGKGKEDIGNRNNQQP